MSRTMKPIPNKFIQAYFKEHGLHGFHGELMIAGDFNDVQSGVMRIEGEPDFEYVIYDVWDHENNYQERLNYIKTLFLMSPNRLNRLGLIDSVVVNSVDECSTWLEEYINLGYEGAMLRDPDSLYKQGRHTLKSQALMKLKKFFDDEAVIIGFEEKMHNGNEKTTDERGYSKRSHKQEGMVPAGTLGALVVKWKDVEFKIGSGYNDQQRQELWDNRGNLVGKLVTFKYQSTSSYGVPRFPIFKALYYEL